MPFGISQSQPDCANWATVKREADGSFTTIGCHETKQDAIDQMIVVSLSEDIEPLGQVDDAATRQEPVEEEITVSDWQEKHSDLNERQFLMYESSEQIAESLGKWNQGIDGDGAHYVAESPFSEEGLVCASCVFYEGGRQCEIVEGDIAPQGICKLWVIAERLIVRTTEPQESATQEEQRQAPSLIAPDFMAASAKRGLRLHEEGLSGDGLMPATVADARRMANGEPLSEAKWRKIPAWIARHIVDLDAVEGDEITAGLVAMLLWGGGSSKESARRAQAYAERIVAQFDAASSEGDGRSIMLAATMSDPIEQRWCITGADEKRIAYTTLDLRQADDGTTLYGYAAVFDSPSEPMPFVEYVKRGAFQKTIKDGADVRLLIDHEGVPLARTKSGTLRLSEDERGLAVEAELDPMNPDAARIISAMKRGDLSQMSFAFRTIKDSWSDDRTVRELREVQLFDVSVVTFPAYEQTVAEIRSRLLQDEAQPPTLTSTSTAVSVRKAQLALARRK